MIKKLADAIIKEIGLPKSEDVELSPESIALLKEYGLYGESAADSEDAKADRKVGD